MKLRAVSWLIVVALATVAGRASGEGGAKAGNARAFDALKKLAGDWVEVGKDGKPTDKLVSSIRVTAGGSVVQETMFPGSDHEMVTMYHLDGDKLMLTHYCVTGNQPRMVADRYSNDGTRRTIGFAFAGATNLASPEAGHMHAAELTIEGNDRIQTHWTYFQDGKPQHDARFDLSRKI